MRHSAVLAVAYASVCALWWGLGRFVPLWRDPQRARFARPWREVGIVVMAILGVLLLGQLWVRGIRFEAEGALEPAVESLNQVLIFAPVIAVPLLRRQGFSSAWVQTRALPWRLLVGLALALVALGIYSGLERGAPSWGGTVREVFAWRRAPIAVQVLLEDLAISILFVRLAAAMGPRRAVVAVAALFAAGHVPSMVARGFVPSEFLGLLRDFGLGVLVFGTVSRGADVAWLWPVHFSLDVTQFLSRPG